MTPEKDIPLNLKQLLAKSLIEALVIAVAASVTGLLVMQVHPGAIPLFADREYETIVPCPVAGGSVKTVNAGLFLQDDRSFFVVDARTEDEFKRWHYKNAVLLTYDYLDMVPEKQLKQLASSIDQSGALKVAVYGDGGRPDTGELLGKEISGQGIKHIYYIKGGAEELKTRVQRSGKTE
jgi:rhodanese-related sulfurtransferase